MRILLEEHEYEAAKVRDVLWEGAFQNVDNYVSIKYVGYFYNPRIKDCVFILPKVLMDGDEDDTRSEKLFGKYDPEDVINLSESAMERQHKEFLFQFAVWVYKAINVYRESVKGDPIRRRQILHRYVPIMGHGRVSRRSHTLLEVIVALQEFSRKNEDFFMVTAKNMHSGVNRINWTRTVVRSPCVIIDGAPVYISPVNKKRVVNFDEELFVIYYSILRYINATFCIKTEVKLGYELIPEKRFERYLKGYGKKRLQEIKYKYFSDRALQLWELCYAFFDVEHEISLATDKQEYLLAKNFYVVFEAMIDELVGDPRDKLPRGLKDQPDGKRVDHMYEGQNLTNDEQNDRKIYYIGDSKYYKLTTELGEEAVYKQFTYARNVIQHNLDLFLGGERCRPYRDEVTEGYDIIPNFFISGKVDNKTLSYADNLEESDKKVAVHISKQFENRLFDRDTLLIAHYDLNFLYILALYARNKASEKAAWKEKVRELFRQKIQEMLQRRFDFYAMTPRGDVATEGFLREHFQELLGKVYTPYDGVGDTKLGKHIYYSLALEKPMPEEEIGMLKTLEAQAMQRARNANIQNENDNILTIVEQGFKCKECPLGVNPSRITGLDPELPSLKLPSPTEILPSYPIESIKDICILMGCIRDEVHRKWIFSTVPKFKRDYIYNVRLDKSRHGVMNRTELRLKRPKFVVMYDLGDPAKYLVYRIRNNAIIKQERMAKSGYVNPRGDYFCFILDERVSIGLIDVAAMIERRRTELGERYFEGAPFCVNGGSLIFTGSNNS